MPRDRVTTFKRLLFLLVIPYQNCGRKLDSRRNEIVALASVDCASDHMDCRSGEKALGELGATPDQHQQCPTGQIFYAELCRDLQRPCRTPYGHGFQHLSNNRYGTCEATECELGFHVENSLCMGNLRDCEVDGKPGHMQWQEASQTYSTCEVELTCKVGEHIEDQACVSNEKACPVEFGIGQMHWTGTAYSSCVAMSCQMGFRLLNQVCLTDLRPYYLKIFQTPCQRVASGASRITTMSYGDDSQHTLQIRGFSDSECKRPEYTLGYIHDYTLSAMSSHVVGAYEVDFLLAKSEVTPTSAEGVKILNSSKFCNVKNWQLNVKRLIAKTNPCLGVSANLYQIEKISTGRLSAGLLDASRDGSNPTLRPRILNLNPKSIGILVP